MKCRPIGKNAKWRLQSDIAKVLFQIVYLHWVVFLWVAGSVALGVIANVYSQAQRCQADVSAARDRFVSAALEQNARLRKFVYAAADVKNLDDLKDLIEKSRSSKLFVYPEFKEAGIQDVGLQWSRSISELMHFENTAMSKYLAAVSHSPLMLGAKTILYGADFSRERLISWQESAKKAVQEERNKMAEQPAAIFELDYPSEITAVLDAPVCTWSDVAAGMVGLNRED